MRPIPPRYPSRADVERTCGCMVIAGAGVLILAIAAWWLWGPVAGLGVLAVAFGLFGLLANRVRS